MNGLICGVVRTVGAGGDQGQAGQVVMCVCVCVAQAGVSYFQCETLKK